MRHLKNKLPLLALALLLTACGGGGGGAPSSANNPGTGGGGNGGGGDGGGGGVTTKTATVAFNLISTATLSAPVQAVSLVAVLPAGTSVATNTGSSEISSSAITVGSGFPSPVILGTYSAAVNKVKLAVLSPGGTARGGEVARLTVTYPSTTTLTAGQFADPTITSSAGADPGSNSILDLTAKLRAFLGITFD